MKKTLLSLLAIASSTLVMAQSHSAMTFVGVSSMKVLTASVDNAKDTVSFAMNTSTTGDITIPAVSYKMGTTAMNLPSFTIHNAQFSMDATTMTATFPEQTFSETLTVDGVEKTITGSSLNGSYSHSDNTLDLTIKFQYGKMPLTATYTICGYYVKTYTDQVTVNVSMGSSNAGPYTNESVSYDVRTYKDGDATLMDVKVPAFVLKNTVMGTLYLGEYTVCGLAYDDTKSGYYRDYASDGLSMHFKAVQGAYTLMDGDYAMSSAGDENILVQIAQNGKAVVTNNFKPGAMPFPIVSLFGDEYSFAAGVSAVKAEVEDGAAYNLRGQRVPADTKGIVIINGKKYFNK